MLETNGKTAMQRCRIHDFEQQGVGGVLFIDMIVSLVRRRIRSDASRIKGGPETALTCARLFGAHQLDIDWSWFQRLQAAESLVSAFELQPGQTDREAVILKTHRRGLPHSNICSS